MNLEEISERICKILVLSSYDDEADEIKKLTFKVLTLDRNEPVRVSAVDNLISRCHPKWLGDYYIKDINYIEWTDLIIEFKNKLNRVK